MLRRCCGAAHWKHARGRRPVPRTRPTASPPAAPLHKRRRHSGRPPCHPTDSTRSASTTRDFARSCARPWLRGLQRPAQGCGGARRRRKLGAAVPVAMATARSNTRALTACARCPVAVGARTTSTKQGARPTRHASRSNGRRAGAMLTSDSSGISCSPTRACRPVAPAQYRLPGRHRPLLHMLCHLSGRHSTAGCVGPLAPRGVLDIWHPNLHSSSPDAAAGDRRTAISTGSEVPHLLRHTGHRK